MLLACCCVHLQTKAGKAAKSTVAEEIADNLSLMLQRFERITGDKPVLVMDNARIQSCLPAGCINSDHGDVELPPQQRVKLPPHSPDMNQPVEQSVGAVKGDVIGQVADYVQKTSKPITAADLTRMGRLASQHFAAGLVFRDGVKKSVHRLPDVWAVVGADADTEVAVPGHPNLHGTAGDWAPAPLR